MKRIIFYCFLSFIFINNIIAANPDSIKFTPKIEGCIRAKYEYNTNLDAHRFQVRNARFSVNGYLNSMVYYKAEIDLSDEGETKMLDAYVRLKPSKSFNFTIGQQKIPFSTDNLRSPHQLYFANRSFIGKQLTGLRDVGATIMFSNKHNVPFDFSAGIYNGDGLYNQQNWKSEGMSFASRVEIFPTKNIQLSANFNSVKPEKVRMNMFDFGGYTNIGNLHIESEFFYKNYQNNVFKTTKGFFAFGAYDIQLNKTYIKKVTPLARFDMMTDNNKGYKNANGTYTVSQIGRSRITSGVTFSLNKAFLNDIRLNYEKYIYGNGVTDNDDKLVLEFVVKF